MYIYNIELYVKTEKRSTLIEVFSKLRDRTCISAKRDRKVLQSIANDNMDIETANIIRAEV